MSEPAEKHQELEPVKEPWTRMVGESAKAYQAFCLFRDLGPTRSHRLAAEVLVEEAPGRNVATVISQLKGWSVDYRWVARAEAYDDHLDRRRLEQAETEMQSTHRRNREVAAGFINLVAERLAEHPPEGVDRLDANGLSLPEAVRVVSQSQMIHDRASAHSTQSLVHINCLEPHESRKMFDELAAGLFKFIPAEAEERADQWLSAYRWKRS